jgi:hypothetical protein
LEYFRRRYLVVKNGRILLTPFLRAVAALNDRREAVELAFLQYLDEETIVKEALKIFFYPRLLSPPSRNRQTVLGQEDAGFESAVLNGFLRERLPNCSDNTLAKTRQLLFKALEDFGLLQGSAQGRFERRWFLKPYQPTLVGFTWALYKEFENAGAHKRSERFILEESDTVKVFLMRKSFAGYLLEESSRQGLLGMEYFGTERQYFLRLAGLEGVADWVVAHG